MWEYRENQTVIGWMKKSINRVFGLSESELMIKWEGKPQGGFLIDFRYEPKGFRIRVDRDRLYPVYDIFIYDNEGAENSLHRMTHFDSEFSPEKIDAAFDLLKEVVDNENIRKKILACKERLEQKESFSEAVKKEGLFNPFYAGMISVFAKAGKIDEAMDFIAEHYKQDTDRRISRALAAIEPTMVVILSLIVGLILLSVMLPLMGIMANIG